MLNLVPVFLMARTAQGHEVFDYILGLATPHPSSINVVDVHRLALTDLAGYEVRYVIAHCLKVDLRMFSHFWKSQQSSMKVA